MLNHAGRQIRERWSLARATESDAVSHSRRWKTSDSSPRSGVTASNENKISDRGRERASQTRVGLESWKSVIAERPAVRCIAWLDDLASVLRHDRGKQTKIESRATNRAPLRNGRKKRGQPSPVRASGAPDSADAEEAKHRKSAERGHASDGSSNRLTQTAREPRSQ